MLVFPASLSAAKQPAMTSSERYRQRLKGSERNMARPSFKEILHKDIKRTFLNFDEFGEEHEINGTTMIVIFDDIENVEREKRTKSNMDGLYVRQKFLYVSADDFGPMPAQDRIVTIDGKKYSVVDATDEAGVYGITLEANRSGKK